MTVPKRSTRGLQDLKTLSGKVDQVSEPYRAYMRITALEMEKVRRGQERQSAMHRVKNIDERFQEIEAEKTALLKSVDERKTDANPPDRPKNAGKPATGLNSGGFKIRY